jgi:alkanesulfonate monooxygenase SsuD/methylene tetrahydromethanopterin reductase-like flavin-dependent oxidoreductase (luciferase family)
VKVGLFFDLRNPEPWAVPWPALYGRTLELLEGAEGLGLGGAWFTEHHQFDDGYLPQPLTFLAAVAARTQRLTLGTAVLLGGLRPAPLVAEEAAVVDQLSGGRLQLGIGAGYSPREFQLYGKEIERRYSLADEVVAEVRRLLDEGGVTPPPAQRPFPLWLGYQGPKGARRAGRLGVGLLSLDRALLEPYLEGLVEGGHDPAGARTGGMLDIVVADDPPAAIERILPHYAHQLNSYRRAHVAGSGAPEPKEVPLEKLRAGIDPSGAMPGLRVLTPADAVGAVRAATDGTPAAHVYLWASVAAMPDDLVQRHVELLCDQVIPALAS